MRRPLFNWMNEHVVKEFPDTPDKTVVMIGGRYVVAPWEQGGPVVSKRTYWAVMDGWGLRVPKWLADRLRSRP